jgi:predicted O-methyltransferase YrrM
MKYTKELKDKRLEELRNTPRIYWLALEKDNTVDGLIDLCEKYLKPTDKCVEVGSFSGVSSQVIALHCGELHCVDPWSWGAVAQAEQMFDSMYHNYHNIAKVKMSSVEASKQYADGSLDLVYIDADHTYASVVEDITAWRGKVKRDGYIAGHDSYMPEVLQAVRDCLGEPIEIFSDTSWIVKL